MSATTRLVIDSNHWVGTTRMGKDAKTSVVTTEGQCHDVPNLFIGDASVFAAYPEKNPTLTNIALSWRMAENLAEEGADGRAVVMERRDVLRILAAGAAVPVLQAAPHEPRFFSRSEYDALDGICEAIIPKDEEGGGAR